MAVVAVGVVIGIVVARGVPVAVAVVAVVVNFVAVIGTSSCGNRIRHFRDCSPRGDGCGFDNNHCGGGSDDGIVSFVFIAAFVGIKW